MSAILTGLLFFLATFVITFGAYALMRLTARPHLHEDSKSVAETTMFRISALHGLILALVFAEELSNLSNLKGAVDREAKQLESIVKDLDRYVASGGSPEEVAPIRTALSTYVRTTVDTEWQALNTTRRLSPAASDDWDTIFQLILDLPAGDDRQTWLRNKMLSSIDAVGMERDTREIAAATDISPIFWIVAFSGLTSLSLCFLAYPTTRVNMALLTIFAFYTGLVLFIIKLTDYPFASTGLVSPVALELLYEQSLAAPVAGSP